MREKITDSNKTPKPLEAKWLPKNLNNIKPLHASTPIRKNTWVSSFNKPLRVLNINFQSIKNKQHLVNNIIDSTKPDIIFGTETWLNPKIKDVEIFPDNYKLYRNDRKKTETDKEGGGVLIAIKKELISSEVYELAPPDKTEMVWAKVDIVGSKTLYLSSFYNPKTSDETSLKNFDLIIRKATQIKNSTLLIGGDFNLPGWDWNNRSLKPNTTYPHLHYFFGNSLDDTCLTQIVDVPTRKDNILDLIITNLPNQVQRVEVIPGLSDHDIVFAEFAIASSKLKQKPRIIPLYKKANWSTIKQEINTLHKHLFENQQHLCVNEMWNCFKTTITKAVKDHIHIKQQNQRTVTHGSQWKQNGSLEKEIDFIKNQKNLGMHHLLKNTKSGITEIKQDGKLLIDPLQKAGALNAQFQSVFTSASNISHTEFVKQCNMSQNTPFPPISKLIIKTEVTRNKKPITFHYTLHNHSLEHVTTAKYLGATISSNLKWDVHINNICKKANSTLGFLRRNLNISSTSIKEQAYKSLVRPSLEYACSVWDPYLQQDIDSIEKVQRRAARFVTNKYRNTSSVGNMLQHLEWRSLSDRRKDSRLKGRREQYHSSQHQCLRKGIEERVGNRKKLQEKERR
ncbi:uncharacterized protein [Mytilus edulis]|uniref:uncharacterized protein n=1 Tax=Mytilus edulis TaxID=6550 RepID=UPI0039F12B12